MEKGNIIRLFEGVASINGLNSEESTKIPCEEVIRLVKELRVTAMKKNTKKRVSEGGITYNLTIDDVEMAIRIPKKYIDINEEYIEELDYWVKADKKNKFKELKRALLIVAASSTLTSIVYEPAKEKVLDVIEKINEDNEDFMRKVNIFLSGGNVAALEDEILIHSGHGIFDGFFEIYKISPYDDHNCIFGEDKSISVEDRIIKFCEENDLEYLKDAALEKYNLLYHDDLEGYEIDLKEIEKEHEQKIKSKKNN